MSEQTLTLKTLMQTLTEAATYANDALRRDYAARMREAGNKGFVPVSQLLSVAGMRVAFAADVKSGEYSGCDESGDIRLEFGGHCGNFKGEIIFKPCVQKTDAACDCSELDFADDEIGAQAETAQSCSQFATGELESARGETQPLGECFENSEMC